MDWQSDVGNDRWIAELFKFKKGGFFIEAGATFDCSSAYVLEKDLEWNGICINANKDHYKEISKIRKHAEFGALWNTDGEVDFYYTPIGTIDNQVNSQSGHSMDLSYINSVPSAIKIDRFRRSLEKNAQKVKVPSIKLETLLDKYNAPDVIDYLALDIEGAEYTVLKKFPFKKYKILAMSIESSEPLQNVLLKNNYIRINNPYCKQEFEHHYVHRDIL